MEMVKDSVEDFIRKHLRHSQADTLSIPESVAVCELDLVLIATVWLSSTNERAYRGIERHI